MSNENNVIEKYGTPYLHYDETGDYTGSCTENCPWNAMGRTPYQPMENPEQLPCHVEYCHPGTWYGTNDNCKGKRAVPITLPLEADVIENFDGTYNTTFFYLLCLIIIVFVVFLLPRVCRAVEKMLGKPGKR